MPRPTLHHSVNTRDERDRRRGLTHTIVAALSSGLLMSGMMVVWGFPAIALPYLTDSTSTTTSTSTSSSTSTPTSSSTTEFMIRPTSTSTTTPTTEYRNTSTRLASTSSTSLTSTTTSTPITPTTYTVTTVTTPTLVLGPEAASWFATLPYLLCVLGSVVGGGLVEWLGPRRLQLLLAPPLALSIVATPFIYWFPSVSLHPTAFFITIRVIQGTIVSLLNSSISVYPCEVSDAQHRGTLASMVDGWGSLGFLLCYAVGTNLHWTTAAWVLTAVTIIPSFLGLMASQESPPWLLRKGRREDAMEALIRLRGTPEAAEQELAEANRYLDKIKQNDDAPWWKVVPLLRKRAYLLPMATAVFMLMLKEFSGLSVFSVYIVRVFQLAGVDFDPFLSSVVVGSVRVAGNFLGSALLHRLPRKVLLVGGNMLTAVATASMGVFFYLHSKSYDLQQVDWIPLAALILFMVGMAIGVGPTTWLVAVEILPGAIRSLGHGVTLTGYATTSFLVSKTFEDTKALLGMHGLFWCYAVGCLSYGLFVLVVVPETRGRSLKDIEVFWGAATVDPTHKSKELETLT